MKQRAVFLDRDGVLNRSVVYGGVPRPPNSLAELAVLPGVVEAAGVLRAANLKLIVATNQPDIARGLQKKEIVDELNDALREQIGFDDLFMCPHDDRDKCACRKPRPGMLIEAAAKHCIDLPNSVMVGDRDRDIEAGRAVGCWTVFVDHGYVDPPQPPADISVAGLLEAVDWILDRGRTRG